VSEPDPNLPEVPHEGAPYQGYGPTPYQPPAPVPPPVPAGYGMPYQQPVPSQQPPPRPLPPEVVQQSSLSRRESGSRGVAASADGEIVQKWGYVFAFSTLIMPILGLVGLILGIITATKPHRERHGLAIIGISLLLGVLAVVLWTFVYDEG
jgi:hypothetical protein